MCGSWVVFPQAMLLAGCLTVEACRGWILGVFFLFVALRGAETALQDVPAPPHLARKYRSSKFCFFFWALDFGPIATSLHVFVVFVVPVVASVCLVVQRFREDYHTESVEPEVWCTRFLRSTHHPHHRARSISVLFSSNASASTAMIQRRW